MKYVVKIVRPEVDEREEVIEAVSAWDAVKKAGALSGGDNYHVGKDGEKYCHIKEANLDDWLKEKNSRKVTFTTKNRRNEWEHYVVSIFSRIPKLV